MIYSGNTYDSPTRILLFGKQWKIEWRLGVGTYKGNANDENLFTEQPFYKWMRNFQRKISPRSQKSAARFRLLLTHSKWDNITACVKLSLKWR